MLPPHRSEQLSQMHTPQLRHWAGLLLRPVLQIWQLRDPGRILGGQKDLANRRASRSDLKECWRVLRTSPPRNMVAIHLDVFGEQ